MKGRGDINHSPPSILQLCILKLGYVLCRPLEVKQYEDWVCSCLSSMEHPLLKKYISFNGVGKVDTEVQIRGLQSSNLPGSKAYPTWSHSNSLGTSAEQGKAVPLSIALSLLHCFQAVVMQQHFCDQSHVHTLVLLKDKFPIILTLTITFKTPSTVKFCLHALFYIGWMLHEDMEILAPWTLFEPNTCFVS